MSFSANIPNLSALEPNSYWIREWSSWQETNASIGPLGISAVCTQRKNGRLLSWLRGGPILSLPLLLPIIFTIGGSNDETFESLGSPQGSLFIRPLTPFPLKWILCQPWLLYNSARLPLGIVYSSYLPPHRPLNDKADLFPFPQRRRQLRGDLVDQGHPVQHRARGVETSGHLPLVLRDGRRVLPLRWADLRHEVWKLDLRWIPSKFPISGYPTF